MTFLARSISLTTIFLVSGTQAVNAQTVSVYFGVAGGATMETGSSPCSSPSCVSPGLGGNALSGGLSGGIRIAQRVTVGVEGSFGQTISKMQADRITSYEREHDTRIVSAVIRVRLPSPRLWVAGGVGSLRSHTSQIRTHTRNGVVVEGPYNEVLQWSSTAATMGLDYKWIERPHLSIVPTIRAFLSRRDRGDVSVRLGLGPVVLRPAIAAEVEF